VQVCRVLGNDGPTLRAQDVALLHNSAWISVP
jgi:hypothetical protein